MVQSCGNNNNGDHGRESPTTQGCRGPRKASLDPEDAELIERVFESYEYVAGLIQEKSMSIAMIGLLKYGSGLPFNRLEGLQGNLEIPLPASTQWDVVHSFSILLKPVFDEFLRQAAAGEVLYHDDTTVKILALMGERRGGPTCGRCPAEDSDRSGLYTSGVVSTRDGHRIALFFSSQKHADENLADVLKRRSAELDTPIQMCDALSRNMPKELETIVANCLAHARRQFVELHDLFPEECRFVLESFKVVYQNDATARQQGLSAAERLAFHQSQS